MNHRILSVGEVQKAAAKVAVRLVTDFPYDKPILLYGIPRGGVCAASMVLTVLQAAELTTSRMCDTPEEATVFIDDIVDSGKTRNHYQTKFPGVPFYALYEKGEDWLVFPWEGSVTTSATDIPLRLLEFIGEDPARQGLQETPRRFLKAWEDWTSGYRQNVADVLTVFEDGAEQYDEIVLVKNLSIYSHCEHHCAPFFGQAHIGYIPNHRILGLSKFGRVVEIFARRLQVQERLTTQIAHALNTALYPQGMAVVLECRHLCMESRGIRAPGTITTTSCMLGAFKDKPEARAEFMRLVR